jgi:hypothetical protein
MNKETVQKDDTYVLSTSRFVTVVLILVLLYGRKEKKTIVAKTRQQKRVETTPIFPSHFKDVSSM